MMLPKHLELVFNRYPYEESFVSSGLNGYITPGGRMYWGSGKVAVDGSVTLNGGVFEVYSSPTQAQSAEMFRVCEENSPNCCVKILFK
jgi:hypothetical protein